MKPGQSVLDLEVVDIMDLGGARSSQKRNLPPLDRSDDAKRPKLATSAARPKVGAAPFDLANVLSGASDAAKLRQQYVIQRDLNMPVLFKLCILTRLLASPPPVVVGPH